MGYVSSLPLSGNTLIDSLLFSDNYRWGNGISDSYRVTYSFPNVSSSVWRTYDLTSEINGWSPLTTAEQQHVEAALELWSNVANIDFVQVLDNQYVSGDLRFAHSDLVESDSFAAAWAYIPTPAYVEKIGFASKKAGDVWLDNDDYSVYGNTTNYQILIHEIGHAIGLEHPHEGIVMDEQFDNQQYSVMSYNFTGVAGNSMLAIIPQILDIAAIQYLYGANTDYNSGNTYYEISLNYGFTSIDWQTGAWGASDFSMSYQQLSELYFYDDAYTIWDGGGNDTFDFTGYNLTSNANVVLDIGDGWFSYNEQDINYIGIALGTVIENVIGTSANDTIYGNDTDNVILSQEGDDTIIAYQGDDNIDGGDGDDTVDYAFNNGSWNDYVISETVSGFTVTDIANSFDGTDSLTSIETLLFDDFSVNLAFISSSQDVETAVLQQIQELYVAFFNRIPDADGLEFWVQQYEAGQSVSSIAEQFYQSGIQYSDLTGFSASMSNADFINTIYNNVLGRSDGADEAGLAFWDDALISGVATNSSLVAEILAAAHNFSGDAEWGWVANLLDNKLEVANTVTTEYGLNYLTDEASISGGMAMAQAVTDTDISAALTLIGVSVI
jgi:Ca2+-binding RTX toxin-like protein